LHDCNLLFQTVYTVPLDETVNQLLREAQAKIVDGHLPVAPLKNDTAAALLRLRQYLANGGLR